MKGNGRLSGHLFHLIQLPCPPQGQGRVHQHLAEDQLDPLGGLLAQAGSSVGAHRREVGDGGLHEGAERCSQEEGNQASKESKKN